MSDTNTIPDTSLDYGPITAFTKYWITTSCAPESITVVRNSGLGALLAIRDESGNRILSVIEHFASNMIIGIGSTYQECLIPVQYTHSEACAVIAEKLALIRIVTNQ